MAALVLVSGPSAWAQQTVPASARDFSIAAGPLDLALERFALQSGVQVLYDSPPNQNMTAPEVAGHLPPQAALELLLDGSGLGARWVRTDAVILFRTGQSSARTAAVGAAELGQASRAEPDTVTLRLEPLEVEVPPDVGAFEGYGRLVQANVGAALRRDSRTRQRRYRLRLRLWVDDRGQIVRPSAYGSSQDAKLDNEIARVVTTVVLPHSPPPGMPQPLRVRIEVN